MNFEEAKEHCLAGGQVRLPDWADVEDPKDAAFLVMSDNPETLGVSVGEDGAVKTKLGDHSLVKKTSRQTLGAFLPGNEEVYVMVGQTYTLDEKGQKISRNDWEECEAKQPPQPKPDPAVTWHLDEEEKAAGDAKAAKKQAEKDSAET